MANLKEATARGLQIGEQEYAHLRELAYEIAAGMTDSNAILASLPEHRLPELASGAGYFYAGSEPLEPMLREVDTRHRILLCMELRRLIPATTELWQDFFFPAGGDPDPSSFQRISYQKNNYTDTAYQLFSEILKEPRAAYAHSFRSVCEDVYNGLSQYCILPLENSAEGRLTGFSRMIADYDMKIVAVCDVQVGEDKTTRFALLSKNAGQLHTSLLLPRYFEFSYEPHGGTRASDILSAAEFCGLKLFRADIAPGIPPNRQAFHCILEIGRGDLPSFLIYLAMEAPEATHIGIYPNLSGAPKGMNRRSR